MKGFTYQVDGKGQRVVIQSGEQKRDVECQIADRRMLADAADRSSSADEFEQKIRSMGSANE